MSLSAEDWICLFCSYSRCKDRGRKISHDGNTLHHHLYLRRISQRSSKVGIHERYWLWDFRKDCPRWLWWCPCSVSQRCWNGGPRSEVRGGELSSWPYQRQESRKYFVLSWAHISTSHHEYDVRRPGKLLLLCSLRLRRTYLTRLSKLHEAIESSDHFERFFS